MNKKSVLFSFSQEREYASVDFYISNEQYKQEVYRMIDAFIAIIETNDIREETLQPFVAGMRSKDSYVWGVAGRRLAQLSHYSNEAEEILLGLTKDSQATIRFRIAATLVSFPTETVIQSVLSHALIDKSKKVRMKAADSIYSLKRKDFLTYVEELLQKENDSDVQKTFRFVLAQVT